MGRGVTSRVPPGSVSFSIFINDRCTKSRIVLMKFAGGTKLKDITNIEENWNTTEEGWNCFEV